MNHCCRPQIREGSMADSVSASSADEEKSWLLFGLLVKIGHPVLPKHLASQCRSFAASPDFIRYLTSIPGSPLFLMENGLVCPSMAGFFAIGTFLPVEVNREFVSRFRFWNSGPSESIDVDDAKSSLRKRKRTVFGEIELSKAKRRLLLPSTQGEGDHNRSPITNGVQEISFENYADTAMVMVERNFPATKYELQNLDSGNAMIPLHLDTNGQCSSCPAPIFEHKDAYNDGNESIFEGEISGSVFKAGAKVAHLAKPVLCGEELANAVKPKDYTHVFNLDTDETMTKKGTQATYQNAQFSSTQKKLLTYQKKKKQLLDASSILKGRQKNDLLPKQQTLTELLASNNFHSAPKNFDQCKDDEKFITRHKRKQSCKEKLVENSSMTPKVEEKAYPSFEAFTIEEEEGSGGYGTVYRARRKNDGKRVAIKCPHHNASKYHVNNEQNMLQRFGGKNFIIKFEGCFKSGSSDCFVLEHVEHDRPEVLKKEIDIIQLQWYGYCMFRALVCLHKEGVVHRDVKPGNFLFSRKLNKGYLIDFNLAMDLKQKYDIGSKPKPSLDASINISLPSGSAPLVKEKNPGGSKSLTSNKKESYAGENVKRKTCTGPLKNCPDKAGGNLFRAQGNDGSGITSAKDVTSTITPSVERLREPLPFRGRKELISLVHSTMQCSDNSSIKGPTSQRKRVTAPSGKMDGKIFCLTPMSVAGGFLRSRGDGKHKRDGPCVGTKGFRAPEVLLRSQFQGPKVDIWSAGVTLLYLVIGKTPFTGDPEQNIKDIAKLRGNEELWEVAKLHDCELSFPVELLDERYVQSWDLETWCKAHTKRPEFLQHIPKSFFDLIDKCLIVNPRNRISVEEVLRHEFFVSCHEILKTQRMIRKGHSSDTAASVF